MTTVQLIMLLHLQMKSLVMPYVTTLERKVDDLSAPYPQASPLQIHHHAHLGRYKRNVAVRNHPLPNLLPSAEVICD